METLRTRTSEEGRKKPPQQQQPTTATATTTTTTTALATPHRSSEVSATQCANCGTTTTPLWRRAPNGDTICNACGLYFKARNQFRPASLKRNHPQKETQEEAQNDCGSGSCPGDGHCNGTGGSTSCAGCPAFNQHQVNKQTLICANCRTTTTPLWRRDEAGNTICNACGLYYKLHNMHRPVSMKRSVIKRRKRMVVTEEENEDDAKRKRTSPALSSSPTHTTAPKKLHPPQKKEDEVPAIEDYIVPKRKQPFPDLLLQQHHSPQQQPHQPPQQENNHHNNHSQHHHQQHQYTLPPITSTTEHRGFDVLLSAARVREQQPSPPLHHPTPHAPTSSSSTATSNTALPPISLPPLRHSPPPALVHPSSHPAPAPAPAPLHHPPPQPTPPPSSLCEVDLSDFDTMLGRLHQLRHQAASSSAYAHALAQLAPSLKGIVHKAETAVINRTPL